MSSTDKKSAELKFRQAFERLKKNKPKVLPAGTPVTQNNVAKEAERDPSALKKDRYPMLVLEIQAYIAAKRERTAVNKRSSDNRSRVMKQKLADCQKQRDKLSSILAAQDNYIEELLDKIAELESGKIRKM